MRFLILLSLSAVLAVAIVPESPKVETLPAAPEPKADVEVLSPHNPEASADLRNTPAPKSKPKTGASKSPSDFFSAHVKTTAKPKEKGKRKSGKGKPQQKSRKSRSIYGFFDMKHKTTTTMTPTTTTTTTAASPLSLLSMPATSAPTLIDSLPSPSSSPQSTPESSPQSSTEPSPVAATSPLPNINGTAALADESTIDGVAMASTKAKQHIAAAPVKTESSAQTKAELVAMDSVNATAAGGNSAVFP